MAPPRHKGKTLTVIAGIHDELPFVVNLNSGLNTTNESLTPAEELRPLLPAERDSLSPEEFPFGVVAVTSQSP